MAVRGGRQHYCSGWAGKAGRLPPGKKSSWGASRALEPSIALSLQPSLISRAVTPSPVDSASRVISFIL